MTKMIEIILLCVQSALAGTQQPVPSTILQESKEITEVLRRRIAIGLGNTACEDRNYVCPALGKSTEENL